MMQVARAAFQVQVNPLRQATDPMSHTLAYDDTNPGLGSSSPTNPMIDPIDSQRVVRNHSMGIGKAGPDVVGLQLGIIG